uniref:EGF-like domain-containing protein n=1 Tax=Globodera pallida TaxID=36090 RepID=A0A183CQH9_GLOPA
MYAIRSYYDTVCTNFFGGFDCQCKSGFSGDPLTGGCKDINECEMADHYCGSNANCTNLVGTFRCECLDGFERVPNTSNGECKDIDECTLHAACHRAATCTNVEGSYRCGCVDGFIGNGTECHETILFPIGQKRTTADKKMNFTIVQLADPIKIFGQNYTQIYISPNAVIFMPLFAKFASKYNGFIDIQQIDEQSSNSKGPLSRAALQIQQHFRIDNFKPQRLFIATWGEMNTVLQSANTGGSTFQLILVDGTLPTGTATFAIFLYESVEEISGGTHFFTGILHPLEGILSLIPLDQLVTGTNVGQPGK